MENKFYVYEWYNVDTDEVFYVGKGCGKRYKEISRRNELFKEYYEKFNVDVRLLKENLSEEEAFYYEKYYVEEYKQNGQCSCNLAEAGYGGCNFVWTDELREYWSQHNPMKDPLQRERMSKNNPMKNAETAMKNGAAHKRAIYIGDNTFDGVVDAKNFYNRSSSSILAWLRRGRTPFGEVCGYVDGKGSKKVNKGIPILIEGRYYDSIAAASIDTQIAESSLRNALKKNKLCKGLKVEYANQQPSYTNSDNSSVEGSTTNG